jgi:hypothetical protein
VSVMPRRRSIPCRFLHTLSAHCPREVSFLFTVDAAAADDLLVSMLRGEDEDERGRRYGIPSFSREGV